MTIGIDARIWGHPGMGRYLREVFFAMRRQAPEVRFQLLMYQSERQELDRMDAGIAIHPAKSPIYSLSEQWELSAFSKRKELLHVPHFNIPLLSGAKKLVVTVYDLIYLKDTVHSGSWLGRAYVNFMFKAVEKKADVVIVVSEYTKMDLLNYFPKLRGRVFVIPAAVSSLFYPITSDSVLQEARKRHGLNRPFVLFVGSLKPHKNVSLLVEAMADLRREKKIDAELVLVGRKDEKDKKLLGLMQKYASFIRRFETLPDEQLLYLYNLAEVFVLPSFWEGFGLPALEAMACGTPTLLSNRASLPEVGGQAALYFDPTSVDALKEGLCNVLQNEDVCQKMRVDGLLQAKEFSWDKTAVQTLKIYEQVLR